MVSQIRYTFSVMKTQDRLNPGSHVFDVDLDELDSQDLTPDLQGLINRLQRQHRDAIDQVEQKEASSIKRTLLKASALTDQIEEAATRDETLARSASYHNKAFEDDGREMRERLVARIDLNNFKAVNTAFGHEGGDRGLHLFATLVHGVLYQNVQAVNEQTFEEFAETYNLFEYGESFEDPPNLSTLLQDTLHDAGSDSAVLLDGDEGDIEAPDERLPYNVEFTRPGGDEFALFLEADEPGGQLDDRVREQFVEMVETLGETSLRLCAPDEAMERLGVEDPERQREMALAPLSDEAQTRSGGFVGQVSIGVGVSSNRSDDLRESLDEIDDDSLRNRVKNSLDDTRSLTPYRLSEEVADYRCEVTKNEQKAEIARRLQNETQFIEGLKRQMRAQGKDVDEQQFDPPQQAAS